MMSSVEEFVHMTLPGSKDNLTDVEVSESELVDDETK